jgi:hypothetical protein
MSELKNSEIEKNQRGASSGSPWSFLNSQFCILTSVIFAYNKGARSRPEPFEPRTLQRPNTNSPSP